VTRKQQRAFVVELIDAVRRDILRQLPRVPEDWDGHELRQLIADHFQKASFTLPRMRRRKLRYKSEVLTRNLV
jgi:hypothetical protein